MDRSGARTRDPPRASKGRTMPALCGNAASLRPSDVPARTQTRSPLPTLTGLAETGQGQGFLSKFLERSLLPLALAQRAPGAWAMQVKRQVQSLRRSDRKKLVMAEVGGDHRRIVYAPPPKKQAVAAYSLYQKYSNFGSGIGDSVVVPFHEALLEGTFIHPDSFGRLYAHYPVLSARYDDVLTLNRKSYFVVLIAGDGFAWMVWWMLAPGAGDDPGLRMVDAIPYFLRDPEPLWNSLPTQNRQQCERDFGLTREERTPLFAHAKQALNATPPAAVSAAVRLQFLQRRNQRAGVKRLSLCEVPSELWQPDSLGKCSLCLSKVARFSRHHCRACGGLVCDRCPRGREVLYGRSTSRQRVCDKCAVLF